MDFLALIIFPKSDHHARRRQLKVLLAALTIGLSTAAVLGLGLYYFNGQPMGGH